MFDAHSESTRSDDAVSYRVIFHSEARDEALNAVAYIAKHASLATAMDWYQGLESAISTLSEHPNRCPLARESHAFPDMDIRQLLFKSHRLIYRVQDDEVHVLHVRHVAQTNLAEL